MAAQRSNQRRVIDPAFQTYVGRLMVILTGTDAVPSDHRAAEQALLEMRRALEHDEVPFTHVDGIRKLMRQLELTIDS